MKHLTKEQLTALLTAAKARSEKDHLMILVAYWHGLRATEVVNLTDQNLVDGFLTVQRLKGSMRTCQPLVRSADPRYDESPLERLTGRFFPMSKRTFERRMKEYGKTAGIPQQFAICHILKHSCKYGCVSPVG